MSKSPIRQIVLHRAEGPTTSDATCTSFEEANKILQGWSRSAPKEENNEGVHKTDVIIEWENDISYKLTMGLTYENCNALIDLQKMLEHFSGYSCPSQYNNQQKQHLVQMYQETGMYQYSLAIIDQCNIGHISPALSEYANINSKDYAFLVDLDTNGIVVSGPRNEVNIKALTLATGVNNPETQKMLQELGLPPVHMNMGILYGPFSSEEITNIKEKTGFAGDLYKKKNPPTISLSTI